MSKTIPIDLISGSSPEFCCGAMCPRQEVQVRIDEMQSLINRMYGYYHLHEPDSVNGLSEELTRLQTVD